MRTRLPVSLFAGLCSVVATLAAPVTNLPAAEPFHWGVNGHPVSQESYYHVPLTTQLDLLVELGVGWYRIDVSAGAFAGNTARWMSW